MSQERRRAPRLRVNLETVVEYGSGRFGAVILDLGPQGCFVLTAQEFLVGAAVKVEVGKPGLLHMTLEGAVVRQVRARGIGIRFRGVTATQQLLLTKLLQSLRRPRGR